MSAQDPRNGVIHFGRKRSTSAEIGDPLRPKQAIHFRRNAERSTSAEIRRRHRRNPDTTPEPAPQTSRRHGSDDGGGLSGRSPYRRGDRDARRVLAVGSWRRVQLAGTRRAAPWPTAASGGRSHASAARSAVPGRRSGAPGACVVVAAPWSKYNPIIWICRGDPLTEDEQLSGTPAQSFDTSPHRPV